MANIRHTYRTRIKKDIVTEFLPSVKKSDKAIILCSGMPTMPSKKRLMNFLADQGYWVFFPRYRGTWESGGEFLKASPAKDINDVVSFVRHARMHDVFSGRNFAFRAKKIY